MPNPIHPAAIPPPGSPTLSGRRVGINTGVREGSGARGKEAAVGAGVSVGTAVGMRVIRQSSDRINVTPHPL